MRETTTSNHSKTQCISLLFSSVFQLFLAFLIRFLLFFNISYSITIHVELIMGAAYFAVCRQKFITSALYNVDGLLD